MNEKLDKKICRGGSSKDKREAQVKLEDGRGGGWDVKRRKRKEEGRGRKCNQTERVRMENEDVDRKEDGRQ